MDLKSGYPFWAVKNGLMHAFPPLQNDTRCDVAIIGGGISGALIADTLSAAGHEVVVVEQRDIGWGSTAASTALLQYEIDTHLAELAESLGEDNAVLAYRACVDAIGMLEEVANGLGDVGFEKRDSLYYASRRRDKGPLQEEFELRRKHGFDVSWLASGEVKERFGIPAPAAILNRPAASVDPYRLTYRLLTRLQERGVGVHDRTRVARVVTRPRSVDLELENGARLIAGHVIVAAGYEGENFLPKNVASNRSSYAFVTDPISRDDLGVLATTMMWETARPYLYLRTTSDNRLLVGGEDDRLDIPRRRDAMVDRKARSLAKKAQKLFPHLDITPTFSWAGTFAETSDGLPYFGPHPATGPRMLFAMAYGGNGITYSMLGAGLLQAMVEGKPHRLAPLFTFERLNT
ncbi:NAD(P)/FAD-dependent oxidoreductase [Novilysobacter avium]|uniref:FAD-dependent oxidoreductase n=1 Tax=Novilysobacter avium TaxID=2781023 RepID=A0A7S6UL07_9GAMM|nr:FAD-dependent oxidoreductase [Lysobacter avium]QOW22257.1 FAD-dependent oxidoreductase [Lysobacter avium]